MAQSCRFQICGWKIPPVLRPKVKAPSGLPSGGSYLGTPYPSPWCATQEGKKPREGVKR